MRRVRKGDPSKAVAYLRVSTEDQRLGPEAQRASIVEWAGREGVTVVAWHVDQGVSGGSELGDRPGLMAAIDDLRGLQAGRLAIAKRDRLARDVAVAALIERAVQKQGGSVVSADGIGNGDGAADSFMRAILDAASAYERELIRHRTRTAMAVLKAQGKRAGTVPFGFTADAGGKLVANQAEQAVIRLVRQLGAQGLSRRAIVAHLRDAGVVSRAGKPLIYTQVQRIADAS